MVSITEGSQERKHSTKGGNEEKSATQEENCNIPFSLVISRMLAMTLILVMMRTGIT